MNMKLMNSLGCFIILIILLACNSKHSPYLSTECPEEHQAVEDRRNFDPMNLCYAFHYSEHVYREIGKKFIILNEDERTGLLFENVKGDDFSINQVSLKDGEWVIETNSISTYTYQIFNSYFGFMKQGKKKTRGYDYAYHFENNHWGGADFWAYEIAIIPSEKYENQTTVDMSRAIPKKVIFTEN